MVRHVDSGGVVDGICIDDAITAGKLNSGSLGKSEVATFAYNAGSQLICIDTDVVVGGVLYLAMALITGFDVGADATVIEQVNRCLQNRLNQCFAREPCCFNLERLA